jgi:hypothetical protein
MLTSQRLVPHTALLPIKRRRKKNWTGIAIPVHLGRMTQARPLFPQRFNLPPGDNPTGDIGKKRFAFSAGGGRMTVTGAMKIGSY